MAPAKDEVTLEIGGREVVVTHPGKLLIPGAGVSKLDLVNYYLAVADGALRGAGGAYSSLSNDAKAARGALVEQWLKR